MTKMAGMSLDVMSNNNLTADDVHWVVPHQANMRIIEATGRRMNISPEKVMVNIHKYGNTTNATIPCASGTMRTNSKRETILF